PPAASGAATGSLAAAKSLCSRTGTKAASTSGGGASGAMTKDVAGCALAPSTEAAEVTETAPASAFSAGSEATPATGPDTDGTSSPPAAAASPGAAAASSCASLTARSAAGSAGATSRMPADVDAGTDGADRVGTGCAVAASGGTRGRATANVR